MGRIRSTRMTISNEVMPMKVENRCLGALACGLFLVACGWAVTVGADEALDGELRAAFDQLVESVLRHDDTGLETVVCLDLLAPARAQRQARLGLLADPKDPTMLTQFRQKYRTAVYDRFDDLLRQGQPIEHIDTSRVQLSAPGDEKNETLRVSENPEDAGLEITGSGIVGVKLLTSERIVDIDVNRIGDRWCLSPVAVP